MVCNALSYDEPSCELSSKIREKQVTMFFSDIANFTTIVESIDPESCLLLLSRYFNAMSKANEQNNGCFGCFKILFFDPKELGKPYCFDETKHK